MQRIDVLKNAAQAVAGRPKDYGPPENSFKIIAAYWEMHLAHRGVAFAFTPADVALMLMDLKRARLVTNIEHIDSWVDLAGYAACGAEVATAMSDKLSEAAEEALTPPVS